MNEGFAGQWQSLLRDAAQLSGYAFQEDIEQYLSLTLAHFTTQINLAHKIVAFDFLLGVESLGRQGGMQLRHVGDECLVLAGLFPEFAHRKNVTLNYFIGMGQEAYHILSHPTFRMIYDPDLFNKLSADFKQLTEVLQNMRLLTQKSLH